MKADLHLHSTASDGTLEPGELVALAAELGESVDENALKGMTYDQLVAKNQELQQKKAESQRQANLAAIAKLDPDAAAALKDADANAVRCVDSLVH